MTATQDITLPAPGATTATDKDDLTPAAVAVTRYRESTEQRRRREVDEYMAWLESDECPADIREQHERGRELDRIAQERYATEAAAEREQAAAGAIPLPPTMWGHLAWLRRAFGDDGFTTADVRMIAQAAGWTAPLGAPDPHSLMFTRQLGRLYASVAGQDFDGLAVTVAGTHGGTCRWAAVREADGG